MQKTGLRLCQEEIAKGLKREGVLAISSRWAPKIGHRVDSVGGGQTQEGLVVRGRVEMSMDWRSQQGQGLAWWKEIRGQAQRTGCQCAQRLQKWGHFGV